jgi:hypothetical protein
MGPHTHDKSLPSLSLRPPLSAFPLPVSRMSPKPLHACSLQLGGTSYSMYLLVSPPSLFALPPWLMKEEPPSPLSSKCVQ